MASVQGQTRSEERRIETTCLHGLSWLRVLGDRVLRVFQLLIVVEEEHFVLQDRPAYRTAEVVVAHFALGASVVEVVSRIQGVVLEIVIEGAMKLIGSALADDVENRATSAVLGGGVGGNHVDLRHGFALTLVNVGAVG